MIILANLPTTILTKIILLNFLNFRLVLKVRTHWLCLYKEALGPLWIQDLLYQSFGPVSLVVTKRQLLLTFRNVCLFFTQCILYICNCMIGFLLDSFKINLKKQPGLKVIFFAVSVSSLFKNSKILPYEARAEMLSNISFVFWAL